MKHFKIFIAAMCLIACDTNSSENRERIKYIDGINEHYSNYEIKIDSVGNYLDTVSINRYKKNKKGVKIYSEVISLEGLGYISKSYYRENGEMFYSVLTNSTGKPISIFENWQQNGRIVKASAVNYALGKPRDTTYMSYYYDEDSQGNTKKLAIRAKLLNDSSQTVILYNRANQPVLEYYIQNGDTLTKTKYEYNESNKLKQKIIHQKEGQKTLLAYTADNILTEEKRYQGDSLISEKRFQRDKGDNIIVQVLR